ncbi:MAG: hypothetical protein C3F13_11660 [Anaerolineales bacterium]|nr:glycosyltransferase [Anaerolineae bacterium]PWB52410.1 MAG: hypothetical protein C3F13_11660 [Anaerolineales bacterium]
MLGNQPFISVIIPVRNAKLLKSTIDSLARQTRLDLVNEILIVGQQETQKFTALENLKYIKVDDLPTPAHNRNIGARSAVGDWLVFTDSDCIPRPNWIEQLAEAISSTELVIAGAVDVPENMSYWGMCDHYFGFSTTAYGFANRLSIAYAPTLNFAIKRPLFNEVGGFNESFLGAGGEDREFCWRIIQHGVQIRYAPRAIVIHDHPRKDFHSAARHIFNYGIVTGQFRAMYADQWSIFQRTGMKLVRIPIIGELGGFVRIIIRGMMRLFNGAFLKKVKYLPGILILDLSHTLGMIKALRETKI